MWRETIINIAKEILQTALISLGIFFFVYIFLVQPHRVKGESMVSTFADGELLLTEKVTYRIYKPKRGDVIVFQAPEQKVDFIKRIVALPGEEVKVTDGKVYINEEELKEPYEPQHTEGFAKLVVPQGEYFVLGDNRGASSDSRVFGTITKSSIKGKVWLVYWPIIKNESTQGWRRMLGVDYNVMEPL